jgi:hypothetical protein
MYSNRQYKFDRRGVIANEINDIWTFDLVDMSSRRAGYILNVVDVFSRKAGSYRISTKKKESIKYGLQEIFRMFEAKPNKIWSDMESALISLKPWLDSQNIELYHTQNSYHGVNTHSVPIVERFNRSMRDYMMQTVKTEKPNQNYLQLTNKTIKDFIPLYNNRVHSTLGVTPNEVYDGNIDSKEIKQTHIENYTKPRKNINILSVGQKVLVAKSKEIITSKFDPKYYKDVATIIEVLQTNPITYKVDKFEGSFYRQQLIKA